MVAKSLTKMAISPTAPVPVITTMWRAMDPVTKRGAGARMAAGGDAETDMGRLWRLGAGLATPIRCGRSRAIDAREPVHKVAAVMYGRGPPWEDPDHADTILRSRRLLAGVAHRPRG